MNIARVAHPVASLGTIVSAASCPACFPALAGLGAALGLTVFSEYEGLLISRILPLLAAVALLSHLAGWWVHRQWWRSALGAIGPTLVLVAILAYLGTPWGNWMFDTGVAGMVATSLWDIFSPAARKCAVLSAAERTSVLTCPECGHQKEELMPIDACVYFYECEACNALLRPRPGDCCVFCSYGSRPCPPKAAACCAIPDAA